MNKIFRNFTFIFISGCPLLSFAVNNIEYQAFIGAVNSNTDSSSFNCAVGLSCSGVASSMGYEGGIYGDYFFNSSVGIRSGLVVIQRVYTQSLSGGLNGTIGITIGYLDVPLHLIVHLSDWVSTYIGIAYSTFTGVQLTTHTGIYSGSTGATSSGVTPNPLAKQLGFDFIIDKKFVIGIAYEPNFQMSPAVGANPDLTVTSYSVKFGYSF
jgi:hypothetical protein